MIRIKKPPVPPKILQTKGKTATENLRSQYETGDCEFEFDNKVYGSKSVKNSLIAAQLNKCAFCETKLPRSSGDVEHFRPKGGYKQKDSDKLEKPGYFWLAYNWENLFFSCEYCNRIFKKNLFPLENPDEIAVSYNNDLNREKPLLINPALENPEDFISFEAEIAVAVNKNLRGQITIEYLGLNDDELVEDRRKQFVQAKLIFDLARNIPETETEIVEEARTFLNLILENSEEYSAMFRSAIRENFFRQIP